MNLWSKIKELFVKTCNILVKNKNTVYATCVTMILCMLWIFATQIKTSAAILETQKEALIVVDGVQKTITVQNEIILLQKEIIKKQNKELMDGRTLLKMQNDLIKDLIKRIRALNFDPDSWT
jgi:predicted GH43/DUF377 family glycosyl hydrolase